MNQGSFNHNVDPIVLTELATQTGSHTLVVNHPAGGTVQESFAATSSVAFSIPNIFPEHGTFQFRIVNPDGTDHDDGSGCSMTLNVLLVSCSPA